MPNWCYNDIKFYSEDKRKVEYLHHFLEKWLFNDEVFPELSTNWYGKALYGAGIISSDNANNISFPCRGFADEISEVDVLGKISYFTLTSNTAWCPMNQIWGEILNSLKLDEIISFAIYSEEPGMETYEIYDPDNLFFKNVEIIVDGYGSDEIEKLKEYQSKSGLIPELQKFLNTTESDFGKLCKLVDEYTDKKCEEGEDSIYLCIHEIRRCNEPY